VTRTYIGKSSQTVDNAYVQADFAGIFLVDEYMTDDTMTAIADGMKQGVDFTTACSEGCIGCSSGKYKVAPGPAACTNCGVHTYSTAVAASSAATCEGCPDNTVSALGSGVITACTCNSGYTGADDNTCGACNVGQWKDAIGSAVCTDCGLGTYSGLPAAKTALTCTTLPGQQ
jgi:hypothetical protein